MHRRRRKSFIEMNSIDSRFSGNNRSRSEALYQEDSDIYYRRKVEMDLILNGVRDKRQEDRINMQ